MRVVFMGSPEFAVPALRRLVGSEYEVVAVYTQPDRPAGRGRTLQPPPAKKVALDCGLPVYQPERLSAPEATAALTELAPDLIVIAAFGQILKPPVLELPTHGVVNVHASLLPRHRGAAPVAAAILAGDEDTGITIMLTELALDAGPILTQRRISIAPQDTTGSLMTRLADEGADLLMETLPRWISGSIEPQPQDDSQATYAPSIRKEEAIIDWSLSAVDVWRRVRAYNPWPVAFTLLDGQPLRILEASPLPDEGPEPPGTVLPLPPEHAALDGFAVRCGQGTLAATCVQRAGGRAMTGADFLRGQRGLIGRRLGAD
jgi:methionyl-tRNA formyltransferase